MKGCVNALIVQATEATGDDRAIGNPANARWNISCEGVEKVQRKKRLLRWINTVGGWWMCG